MSDAREKLMEDLDYIHNNLKKYGVGTKEFSNGIEDEVKIFKAIEVDGYRAESDATIDYEKVNNEKIKIEYENKALENQKEIEKLKTKSRWIEVAISAGVTLLSVVFVAAVGEVGQKLLDQRALGLVPKQKF